MTGAKGWLKNTLPFSALGVTLAVYYLAPSLWLTGMAAALFIFLCWWRLEMGLSYVILTMPFYFFPKEMDPALWGIPGVAGRLETLRFSVAEFVVLACLAAWVLRRLTGVDRGWGAFSGGRKTWLPPLALLGAASLSLLASQYLWVSLREYRTVILEPLIFYFLAMVTIKGDRELQLYFDSVLLLGVGMAAITLYHYFVVGEVEVVGAAGRALAIYYSPNQLGLFLGRLVPLALVLALVGGASKRWLWVAVAGGLLLSLYVTYSRGAWLAVALAMIFSLWFWRRMPLLTWLVVAGGALIFLPFLPWERLAGGPSLWQRWYIWQAALSIIRDHPIMGIGLDNFLYYYPRYMLEAAWAEPNLSHPHNILLDFWTRLGVWGVGAIIWLQMAFWGTGWRLHSSLKEGKLQGMVLALMASMVSFLVHGFIDNSFFIIDLAYFFWLTFALIMGIEAAAGTGTMAVPQEDESK
ncbi:MAG: O-antigen ligase family protein [Chloroflexi bacterium]|nr:O-antigen ligase family protein [Chloroflexota bacterium]